MSFSLKGLFNNNKIKNVLSININCLNFKIYITEQDS